MLFGGWWREMGWIDEGVVVRLGCFAMAMAIFVDGGVSTYGVDTNALH